MALRDIFKRAEEPQEEITPEIDEALLRSLLECEEMSRKKAMAIPSFGSSVDMVSGIVASIPIRLYRREGGRVEEVTDDPRVELLNGDTGDTLTATEMKKAMVEDYLVGKGGFAYINRSRNKVKSLHYVKCDDIQALENANPIFKECRYQVYGKIYEPWQFVRLLRSTKDGRTGESLIKQNGESLAVAYSTMKYEQTLVKRGGNKRGFVKSDRKLSEQAFSALKNAWKNFYQDSEENVIILNDGVSFQEASDTSVEMQLNENKETNANDIYAMFKMSPRIVRGGADENDRDNYTRYGLMPLLAEFKAAINRSLLLETEKTNMFFDFDLGEFTKANMKDRWAAWANAKRNGLVMPDEFRTSENMPPLGINYVNMGLQDVLMNPEDDTVIVPNMGTVIDLKNPAENPRDSNKGANEQLEGGDNE